MVILSGAELVPYSPTPTRVGDNTVIFVRCHAMTPMTLDDS